MNRKGGRGRSAGKKGGIVVKRAEMNRRGRREG